MLLRYWLALRDAVRSNGANFTLILSIAAMEPRMLFSESKSIFIMKAQGRDFSQVSKMKTLNNWLVFILWTMWVFPPSTFPYITWPTENVQPSSWPISSVSLKPFATPLGGGKCTPALFSDPYYFFIPTFPMICIPCSFESYLLFMKQDRIKQYEKMRTE